MLAIHKGSVMQNQSSVLQLLPVSVGHAHLSLEVVDGALHSLGSVAIGETPVRNTHKRFLPWCDSVDGEVFRRFLLEDIESEGVEFTSMVNYYIRKMTAPFRVLKDPEKLAKDIIRVLDNPAAYVENNFRVGKEKFSYKRLKNFVS